MFDLAEIAIRLHVADRGAVSSRFPQLGREYAAACRSTVCRYPERDCQICSKWQQCQWQSVFSQSYAENAVALKRYQKPPLPFAFSLPAPGESDGASQDLMTFRLVVLGKGINALEMLLDGFRLLIEAEPFERAGIESISSRNLQGEEQAICRGDGRFCGEHLTVLSADWITETTEAGPGRVEVTLLSPLKLISDGKQLSEFSFGQFARTAMRRITSLAYYYCDYEFESDFAALSRQLEQVYCTADRFVPAGRGRQSGLLGSGLFEGNLAGIMPFLLLCSYLNIGKSASYGMGSFRLG